MRGVIPFFRSCGGRTFQTFGRELLRWGTGPRQARARVRSLNATDLAGVTETHALAVIHFYHQEYRRNPANRTARYRMQLGRRALELIATTFRQSRLHLTDSAPGYCRRRDRQAGKPSPHEIPGPPAAMLGETRIHRDRRAAAKTHWAMLAATVSCQISLPRALR
jgi:hypothetical protein